MSRLSLGRIVGELLARVEIELETPIKAEELWEVVKALPDEERSRALLGRLLYHINRAKDVKQVESLLREATVLKLIDPVDRDLVKQYRQDPDKRGLLVFGSDGIVWGPRDFGNPAHVATVVAARIAMGRIKRLNDNEEERLEPVQ